MKVITRTRMKVEKVTKVCFHVFILVGFLIRLTANCCYNLSAFNAHLSVQEKHPSSSQGVLAKAKHARTRKFSLLSNMIDEFTFTFSLFQMNLQVMRTKSMRMTYSTSKVLRKKYALCSS